MKEFIINKNDSGQRTDKFILKAVPKLPKSLLYKYIRLKRIKLNGKRCEISQFLTEGDVLTLYINDEFFENKKIEPKITDTKKLNIIYEDNNIIIVNKPSGMDVHKGSEKSGDTLIDIIRSYLIRNGDFEPDSESTFSPAVCNRLDRNTTGLVIAAKNAVSLREINERIRAREIEKHYLCICCGKPPKKHFTETAFLKKGQHNLVKISPSPKEDYKKIITEFSEVSYKNNLSLIKINLITGRTHQIRAHSAFLGFPVLGDGKYGNITVNKRNGIFYQQLCAYSLTFNFKSQGVLNYLNGKTFKVDKTDFSCKIFDKEISFDLTN